MQNLSCALVLFIYKKNVNFNQFFMPCVEYTQNKRYELTDFKKKTELRCKYNISQYIMPFVMKNTSTFGPVRQVFLSH